LARRPIASIHNGERLEGMSTVTLRSITKHFGSTQVIPGVDLDIGNREFVVFVGPSGCGKSTLLRMIAGLEETTSGQLSIDGQDVTHAPPYQRGVAMVFQSYALYPHMNVFDNMAFGLRTAKTPEPEIEKRVKDAARILQLDALLHRKPKELSGGQRQRVAIGRAIVKSPKVFLFDEPLSNLDAALRVQMRIELARLHRELQATMIYVTHDQVEAMTLADRIVVFNKGAVEQIGTPQELYERPRNVFVATFIGSPKMNILEATAVSDGGGSMWAVLSATCRVHLPHLRGVSPERTGSEVLVGIRPEHLLLTTEESGAISGMTIATEYLGNDIYAYVALDGVKSDPLVMRLRPDSGVVAGQKIHVRMPPDRIHVFDRNGTVVTP
jgi:multiple sugar transport system ATP-binding protein